MIIKFRLSKLLVYFVCFSPFLQTLLQPQVGARKWSNRPRCDIISVPPFPLKICIPLSRRERPDYYGIAHFGDMALKASLRPETVTKSKKLKLNCNTRKTTERRKKEKKLSLKTSFVGVSRGGKVVSVQPARQPVSICITWRDRALYRERCSAAFHFCLALSCHIGACCCCCTSFSCCV